MIIYIVGIIGFFISLCFMECATFSERAIKRKWSFFKLPDMQFHYQAQDMYNILLDIGEEGRGIYSKYLYFDFIFILSFLTLMFFLNNILQLQTAMLTNILYILAIFRALFDGIENVAMLIIIGTYTSKSVIFLNITRWITTTKFVFLILWVIAYCFALLLKINIFM
jgi:hypothetical protein